MLVYVINKNGNPLMPCKEAKARHLLEQGKAIVVTRTPFTIQLAWDCIENTQPITLGVDSGYQNIGLSATTDKQEVFSAEVQLRKDMVKLNSERKMYRKNRRNRKTRYREARFLNRRIPKEWLAPSIQHKLDSHIKVIDMVKKILPITRIVVEVAAFDIQKINNSEIEGKEYQNGEQSGFSNVREYVLYRDGHICQNCKGKSGDKILEVHHIVSRQTGGNRPANLITLCRTCHDKATQGDLKLKVKTSNGFKAESFMTMVRWRLIDKLRELGNDVSHSYGYLAKSKRRKLSLEKSHINDAFVIANGTNQSRLNGYQIKQVRRSNRKLFKGIRSHVKNTAPRFVHGFQRYDKVLWNNVECFIFGRRISGYFELRDIEGQKLNSSIRYTSLKLMETFRTLLIN